MRERPVAELALERDHYIIDIRPMEERRGELGFIPGSLALGGGELSALVAADGLPVVVYCTSGRRSHEFIEGLPAELAERAVNLEGGLLAWLGSGRDVAMGDDGVDAPENHISFEDVGAFLTGLRSCFIGQLVETILEYDLEVDPLELFEQLEAQVGARDHADSAERLIDLIDHAAHLSRLLGTPYDAIAANTAWAYGNVSKFAHELPPLAELHIGDAV